MSAIEFRFFLDCALLTNNDNRKYYSWFWTQNYLCSQLFQLSFIFLKHAALEAIVNKKSKGRKHKSQIKQNLIINHIENATF